MIKYRSIADINKTILDNLYRVPRDIDLIVGIPRSGLLAANMLALHLNLPLADLDGLIEGRLLKGGVRCKSKEMSTGLPKKLKVLVLDDSINFGRQMKKVKAQINGAGLLHEIICAAVYATPHGAQFVDIYFEILRQPRLFEWNIMHHSTLERSCVDIDGVLCHDPTEEQNDDGPMYEDFLAKAERLFIPTVPIGWLVTCRLEKYRVQTEQWLAENGVIYRELIMMDLPSKAARIASGSHSKFKANVYRKTDAKLFIESSSRQAREIAAWTGKQVFCIETWQMETWQTGAERIVEPMHKKIGRMFHWHYRRARNAGGRIIQLANDPDLARRIGKVAKRYTHRVR